MTEYDYSPEAWEKHVAHMDQVSRWAQQTSMHAHEYRNPLVPTPAQQNVPLPSSSGHRKRSKSTGGESSKSSRQAPVRSSTQPTPQQSQQYNYTYSRSSQSLHQPQPQVSPKRADSGRSAPAQHRHSRSHSSSSRPRTSGYDAPPVPMMPPNPGLHPAHRSPVQYQHPQPVYRPTPRPGDVAVVYRGETKYTSPTDLEARYGPMRPVTPQSPYAVPTSPTKQPLLKRVFGNLIGRGRSPAPEPSPTPRPQSQHRRSRSRSRRQSF